MFKDQNLSFKCYDVVVRDTVINRPDYYTIYQAGSANSNLTRDAKAYTYFVPEKKFFVLLPKDQNLHSVILPFYNYLYDLKGLPDKHDMISVSQKKIVFVRVHPCSCEV